MGFPTPSATVEIEIFSFGFGPFNPTIVDSSASGIDYEVTFDASSFAPGILSGSTIFSTSGSITLNTFLVSDTAEFAISDNYDDIIGATTISDPLITDAETSSFAFSLTLDQMEAIGEGSFLINISAVSGGVTDTDVLRVNLILCFAEGTQIAGPDGHVAVEDLRRGHYVQTLDGRSVPVKWIGRQTVCTYFDPSERLRPVRVLAGALGDGLPQRDLTLTADHALLIDGLLINAGALVNGTSILNVPLAEMGDRYTVYHVETEDHDIILAEGTPAETFVDCVTRQTFDNYDEYLALYGEEQIIAEMPYLRITTPRLVPPAVRARLASRAVA